ncbi:MAG: hypothetical protein ACMUEM_04010 [Flavobacteriales bacterium AspAUS03]
MIFINGITVYPDNVYTMRYSNRKGIGHDESKLKKLRIQVLTDDTAVYNGMLDYDYIKS